MGNLSSTYNSSAAINNKTISTAANTGQNYTLMSQKFKSSMRQNRSLHSSKPGGEYAAGGTANRPQQHQMAGNQKHTTSVQTLQNSANSVVPQPQQTAQQPPHQQVHLQGNTGNAKAPVLAKQLPQMVGLVRQPQVTGVYVNNTATSIHDHVHVNNGNVAPMQ